MPTIYPGILADGYEGACWEFCWGICVQVGGLSIAMEPRIRCYGDDDPVIRISHLTRADFNSTKTCICILEVFA